MGNFSLNIVVFFILDLMVKFVIQTRKKMASVGKVVLSYGDSLIRQSEMSILKNPRGWLNDVLLSFYLEYLESNCSPPLKGHVKCYAATICQFIKLCDSAEEVRSKLILKII